MLPYMRSPRDCSCSLTLVCGISLGYLSPLCSNSSPSFSTAAFAFLAAASLPPTDTCPGGCFCAAVPENPPCCCCLRAVSRIPISHAWRCLPFHTIPAVPARLAARCVTSRFACWCLAMSILCCHFSVIPGMSQVLSGSVPAMPAQRCFSQGLGTHIKDLP